MGRKRKGLPIHGWLNIDKDKDMGATTVVAAVRRLTGAAKAGHAGTLDPMATGVLPVALGEATKTVPYMQDAEKEYLFTVKWGQATDTDDAEGNVIAESDLRPAAEQIKEILPQFTGDIKQVPPQFSAVKIAGERAYDIARRGDAAEIKPRCVSVKELALLSCSGETAEFRLLCGKGTYVRALARDMGEALDTYGHVTILRRSRVGGFSEKNAISLAKLEEMLHNEPPERLVLPVAAALDDIPALSLTEEEALKMSRGQVVRFLTVQDRERLGTAGVNLGQYAGHVLALSGGRPLAIAEMEGAVLKPVRVFNL